jgi:hypothetical protein
MGKEENILFLEGNPHSLADNTSPQHFRHLSAPPLALPWVGSGNGSADRKIALCQPKISLGNEKRRAQGDFAAGAPKELWDVSTPFFHSSCPITSSAPGHTCATAIFFLGPPLPDLPVAHRCLVCHFYPHSSGTPSSDAPLVSLGLFSKWQNMPPPPAMGHHGMVRHCYLG